MAEKKIFSCLTVLLIVLAEIALVILIIFCINLFTPKPERFEMEYPEHYTSEYCYNNYIEADPCLIALNIADNSVDDEIYHHRIYFGIKDVPLEKYLCSQTIMIFVKEDYGLVKHMDMENEEAIRDYDVNTASLFWEGEGDIAIIERVLNAEKLKTYIQKSLDEGNYVDGSCGINYNVNKKVNMNSLKSETVYLTIKINFKKYENIVWQTYVYSKDGTYYLLAYKYVCSDIGSKYYSSVFIPIDSDILGFDLSSLDQE